MANRNYNFNNPFFSVQAPRKSSIRIDTPHLIKYAGSYTFRNGESFISGLGTHYITDEAREQLGYKKKILQPRTNKLYKQVRKTLNLCDRFFDSVGRKIQKQYPYAKIIKMPEIIVHLVDRPNMNNYRTTSNALGCAELGSNQIQMKIGFINRSYKNNIWGLEHTIMHELGHAIFGLRHCRKRKNPCPLMARFGSNIDNDDVKLKKKQRRRFKRFIINRYYSKHRLDMYEKFYKPNHSHTV